LKLSRQIPVKRNSAQSADCLSHVCRALAEGKTIIIFPEGELAPPGQRVRAKTGVVRITLVMPLVPNDAMCYVAGLGTISHRRFVIANMLGRGLACVITSAAGAFGGNIPWQGWALLIALFVFIGLAWYVAKSRKSNPLIA